jgi:hypothetical protein
LPTGHSGGWLWPATANGPVFSWAGGPFAPKTGEACSKAAPMAVMVGCFQRAGGELGGRNDTGSTTDRWGLDFEAVGSKSSPGVVLHGGSRRPEKNGGARPDVWSGVMPEWP